jgi:hypothetical protein
LAGTFFALTFVLSILYAHKNAGDSALRRELMKTQATSPVSPLPAGQASPASSVAPVGSAAPAGSPPASGAAVGIVPPASAPLTAPSASPSGTASPQASP